MNELKSGAGNQSSGTWAKPSCLDLTSSSWVTSGDLPGDKGAVLSNTTLLHLKLGDDV